jgi:hypothetical protein
MATNISARRSEGRFQTALAKDPKSRYDMSFVAAFLFISF